MTTALVTGITGQDASYLAEYLLDRGYRVFGMIRGYANPKEPAVRELLPDVELISADLLDQGSLVSAIEHSEPDEVYNLASISFVPLSWAQPELTAQVTGVGTLRMLEAIRIVGGTTSNSIKFYQASSSEMYGKVRETPQTEQTPFHPRSPYGVAKAYAHHITVNYRESYGLHAVSGIMFNHESPRRGTEFVTRKISRAIARIKLGKQEKLQLGNLDAKRDWGFAGDYVEMMHLMLQRDEPSDFVIGTGVAHSVQDFVEAASQHAGLNWRDIVETDPNMMRPAEVDYLIADPSRAKSDLGWTPKVSFEELVSMMVEHDLKNEAATP